MAGWPAWTSGPRVPGGRGASGTCSTAVRLAGKRLAAIVPQPEEIAGYRLADLAEALSLLRGPIRRRCVRRARAAGWCIWRTGGRWRECGPRRSGTVEAAQLRRHS